MISILGQNIKKIRESKGVSAYRLSKDANVGNATISQIESGKRQTLNADTLEKIANALNVSTNELFSLEEGQKYIVTDIEETMNLIFSSEGLTLDNIELSDLEIKQIQMNMINCFNIIRMQRGDK
ncbi:Transcriptional regulator, contains XRE-family HTH domain [Clostridium cavendishii DSM 21758]|uniref:Transcriptional regulator, contains XRE-family HTH domain n=1 Tax=Clostridium cavendishii DSM 21758 TaxID=1121302 RepID=A0A1M6K4N1_9CLOT|nr:helix-turn-helix transcriptional regulator [Clostridium cavendishii]SHJ53916.1 Transcriptional regulator, contains XRE-family HTH domain [Clostridium cavendishii DSM 21758]